MGSRALGAVAHGAGIAVLIFAISFVRALFTRAASSLGGDAPSVTVVGLIDGAIGALAVLALTHAPAWRSSRSRLYPWLAAVAVVAGSGFLLRAVATGACAFVVGWLLADGMRDLLPPATMPASRAMVAVTVLVVVMVGAPCLALATDRLGFASTSGGMLGETAVVTMLSLMVTAPVLRTMLRADASGREPVVPSEWTWGWLNDRRSNTRALGYLYRDPSAGFSFHVLSDLAAAPNPAGLRAAGYRGIRTLRLGQFETVRVEHCAPEVAQSAKRRFEQGGMFGTVVMALTPREQQGLGLPAAPPWATAYLAPPSTRTSRRILS